MQTFTFDNNLLTFKVSILFVSKQTSKVYIYNNVSRIKPHFVRISKTAKFSSKITPRMSQGNLHISLVVEVLKCAITQPVDKAAICKTLISQCEINQKPQTGISWLKRLQN